MASVFRENRNRTPEGLTASGLGPPIEERCGTGGLGPEESHEDEQGAGAPPL